MGHCTENGGYMMRWPWKNFDFYHLDVSKSLILQKKVCWWGVRWQKGMQSKDIIQKSTEHDTFPSTSFPFASATQAHAGLCTWMGTGAHSTHSTLNISLKILTDSGALNWQHCQISMECSDQCSQCSDCCSHVVTACPAPQWRGCSTTSKPCWLPAPPWNRTARNKGVLLPLKIPICTSRHFK